jgi:hypothetical protein
MTSEMLHSLRIPNSLAWTSALWDLAPKALLRRQPSLRLNIRQSRGAFLLSEENFRFPTWYRVYPGASPSTLSRRSCPNRNLLLFTCRTSGDNRYAGPIFRRDPYVGLSTRPFSIPDQNSRALSTSALLILTAIQVLPGSGALLEMLTASDTHMNFCVNSAIRYPTFDRATYGRIQCTRPLPICQGHSILFSCTTSLTHGVHMWVYV